MTFLLLWLLATVDSAFIGYREAAGRLALIDKRSYFRRAIVRGALSGQVAVGVAGIAVGLAMFSSATPSSLWSELQTIATRMLVVYVPYALVLLIAFLVRLYPSVDIRSITSTVIFGPFTFIRPLVVLAGAVWALLPARNPWSIVLLVLVVGLMLSLESVLGVFRKRFSWG